MTKRIFIGGLSGSVDKSSILEFFKNNYSSCYRVDLPIAKGNPKVSKGFAILFIGDEDEYDEILEVKDFNFENRTIHARPYKEGQDLDKFMIRFNKRKLFVSNFPKNWGKTDLESCFIKYGAIEDAFIIKDPKTKEKKKFGFVIFYDEKSIDVLLASSPIIIDGKFLEYSRGKDKKQRGIDKKKNNIKERSSNFYGNQLNTKVNPFSKKSGPEYVEFPNPQDRQAKHNQGLFFKIFDWMNCCCDRNNEDMEVSQNLDQIYGFELHNTNLNSNKENDLDFHSIKPTQKIYYQYPELYYRLRYECYERKLWFRMIRKVEDWRYGKIYLDQGGY